MGEWMEGFAKLLEYKNDALVDRDEETTPGNSVMSDDFLFEYTFSDNISYK
jgi:hypothetical protein